MIMINHGMQAAQVHQHMLQYSALVINTLLTATAILVQFVYTQEPYHVSALTGKGWVIELICRHPDCIQTELGVSHHVFNALLFELQEAGHVSPNYVSLEEQLAIFLYACVTGLTIRHLGERFQRSNETISW
jgi:hypothetical protein